MKKLLLAMLLGCMVWGCATVPEEVEYKNYLVYYDALVGKDYLYKALEKTESEVLFDYNNFSAVAIRVPLKKDADKMQAYFERVKGVVFVQPDQIRMVN